ncbi:hypothetical protein AALO_G00303650 [Alosa alosa]|uniref:Uncharacterized protein n=1 Tax=Alosa alosa TaxID=278164 RepID=A0AAV6FFY9_9TELE|nr:hypothetical protein AALO_G00303650 [Alosa alosa]
MFRSITLLYCPTLMFHSITLLYCPTLMLRSITLLYCPTLIFHSITLLYCPTSMFRSITLLYCPTSMFRSTPPCSALPCLSAPFPILLSPTPQLWLPSAPPYQFTLLPCSVTPLYHLTAWPCSVCPSLLLPHPSGPSPLPPLRALSASLRVAIKGPHQQGATVSILSITESEHLCLR